MRKSFYLVLVVLLSISWAAAQQSGSMAGQSNPNNPNPGGRAVGPTSPDNNGPATAPDASDKAGKADSSQVIEGCLGGAAPDFTVTDKAGTNYKLDIPKEADTSALSAHVGQPVKVKGTVSGKSIQVEQMGRAEGSCPAGSTSQPPAK